jgi:hypothetical protein
VESIPGIATDVKQIIQRSRDEFFMLRKAAAILPE